MQDRTSVDLMQGTLATLILKSLSWGPLHGYGIARWIEQVTEDELLVEEGSLYPALHRLQARDLVTSQWTTSETNRRVRCYNLTEQGRQQLRAELSRWERFSVRAMKPRAIFDWEFEDSSWHLRGHSNTPPFVRVIGICTVHGLANDSGSVTVNS